MSKIQEEIEENQPLSPHDYDGIIFYYGNTRRYTDYFKLDELDINTTDESFIADRPLYHVLLYSMNKDYEVQLIDSFGAHFSDPSAYVQMLQKNTSMFGVMIRNVERSQKLIQSWIEDGKMVMSQLIENSLRKEHQSLPLWTRVKLWLGIPPTQVEMEREA